MGSFALDFSVPLQCQCALRVAKKKDAVCSISKIPLTTDLFFFSTENIHWYILKQPLVNTACFACRWPRDIYLDSEIDVMIPMSKMRRLGLENDLLASG